MKPIDASDRSTICSESPPFAGFRRVLAPVPSPKALQREDRRPSWSPRKIGFFRARDWDGGQPAGFIGRDRNGSAWVLRPWRALSRSRCQEGPAGYSERGRALGGFPRAVERGLAQAGRGAKERCRTQALGRGRHLQDAGSTSALQSL